ncbi:MAG: sigma-70 family RNA polymerase sigma factor [Rudaea sp.]
MTLATDRLNGTANPVPDAEILSRLKAGDMSACTACVNAYSDSLYRLAYRLLRDEAAAEDVVQDTFLNAFKGLDKFDGRSKLSTWLFRIAYNNALMRLRAKKPTASLDDEGDDRATGSIVVPWHETPEDVLSRQEIRDVLDNAISTLPPALRAVFELRDLQGKSTAETAEILGLTETAVKVRLHRARLALREKLNGYFGKTEEPEVETLSCEEVTQYLSDYIDRELDEPLSEAARRHIASCKHCHILLDTTQDTITLCRDQEQRVIPEASRLRIMREIKAGFSRRTPPPVAPGPSSRS